MPGGNQKTNARAAIVPALMKQRANPGPKRALVQESASAGHTRRIPPGSRRRRRFRHSGRHALRGALAALDRGETHQAPSCFELLVLAAQPLEFEAEYSSCLGCEVAADVRAGRSADISADR